MGHPEYLSAAAFARHLHVTPGYITQLRQAGRLVMSDDGKLVRVAESIARIEATRDPTKQGVADRHAAARGMPPNTGAGGDAGRGGEADDAEEMVARVDYQESRAMKERYLAMSAKRDYEVSIRKLLDANEVIDAVADVTTTLRTTLELLPDTLAPQLAALTDEGAVRSTLAAAIHHALEEASKRLAGIATQEVRE